MALKNIFSPVELAELEKAALPLPHPRVGAADLTSRGFILFGLGEYGRRTLESLIAGGLKPEWLVDNDPAKQGGALNGLPVRGAESLSQAGRRYVLLAGQHAPAMLEDCRRHGAENWVLPGALSDFIYLGPELGLSLAELEALPEAEETFSLLADEESRGIYKDSIRLQTSFDLRLSRRYDADIYFSRSLAGRIDYSCFIDAGAYDGDTLKAWLRHVGGVGVYHGFEPQEKEYALLSALAARERRPPALVIETHQAALGAESSTRGILLNGAGSTLVTSENFQATGAASAIQIRRLDELCAAPPPPTVIKADVEGYELEVLQGAHGLITPRTSFLISVYHKKHDIFRLPLYLKQLQPKAEIYLRHHEKKGYGDTVCYALV